MQQHATVLLRQRSSSHNVCTTSSVRSGTTARSNGRLHRPSARRPSMRSTRASSSSGGSIAHRLRGYRRPACRKQVLEKNETARGRRRVRLLVDDARPQDGCLLCQSGQYRAGVDVVEVQMGMVDRGAAFGFASQFPHEEEILFAPLTASVHSAAIDVDVLVAISSPSACCRSHSSKCSPAAQGRGRMGRNEGGIQAAPSSDGTEKLGAATVRSRQLSHASSARSMHSKNDPALMTTSSSAARWRRGPALSKILAAWPKGLKTLECGRRRAHRHTRRR